MRPISNQLKSFMGYGASDSDGSICAELKALLKSVCKPCWELKYCPYGPLVEDFPLPPLLNSEHTAHLCYLKKCLESGFTGDENHKLPITEEQISYFEESLKEEPLGELVDQLSIFEKGASCKEFGHLCPAFFVSEPSTETRDIRTRTRNISNPTIIRVVRRDNNTCQVCGKILLDRDIEIDHKIPFSRGGTSEETNLRVTCFDCNRKKGNNFDFLHD